MAESKRFERLRQYATAFTKKAVSAEQLLPRLTEHFAGYESPIELRDDLNSLEKQGNVSHLFFRQVFKVDSENVLPWLKQRLYTELNEPETNSKMERGRYFADLEELRVQRKAAIKVLACSKKGVKHLFEAIYDAPAVSRNDVLTALSKHPEVNSDTLAPHLNILKDMLVSGDDQSILNADAAATLLARSRAGNEIILGALRSDVGPRAHIAALKVLSERFQRLEPNTRKQLVKTIGRLTEKSGAVGTQASLAFLKMFDDSFEKVASRVAIAGSISFSKAKGLATGIAYKAIALHEQGDLIEAAKWAKLLSEMPPTTKEYVSPRAHRKLLEIRKLANRDAGSPSLFGSSATRDVLFELRRRRTTAEEKLSKAVAMLGSKEKLRGLLRKLPEKRAAPREKKGE
ncbi:TPA: hypothetical protein HA318_04740 [Candidatus Micrarchaeota archaeon]|nr:MAG: hypothetical protein AUJ65_06005 [Candidatus Micrarchaeota archaeon CG1_02_51_15]HII39279.1 hypothetical protein [Candidatus Micrarchaeota archaeon]